MANVVFKEQCLFVGFRQRDWTKVWYQPIGAADPDGTAPLGLFTSTSGMHTREPMEGEVAWIPHFDPNTFSSKLKRERLRMQMQFIYDTWRYLAVKEPHKIIDLDQKLEQPGYTRWQVWFRAVKREKEERHGRRARREQTVRDAGLQVDQTMIESDASDIDSGDDELRFRAQSTPTVIRAAAGEAARRRQAARVRNAAGNRLRTTNGPGVFSSVDSGYAEREEPFAHLEMEEDFFDGRPPEMPNTGSPRDPENTLHTRDIDDVLERDRNCSANRERQPFVEDAETSD